MSAIPLGRTMRWRDRTIAWDSFGSGPALVFLHGTPWSSHLWRGIAEHLAHDFTVYVWDMPGYGASSKHPDHAVDLSTQGELFAHLLHEWGLTQPHVVAHDIGGAVALRARLLHGAKFASLCLVDVVALRPWGSPFFRLVKEHAEVFMSLPAAIHRGVVEAYIRGASHRGLAADDLETLAAPWANAEGQAAFYRQIAQADERYTQEVEDLLADITEPTHIVWGSEDVWIPADLAARLQAAIPESSISLIPDAGHLIQLDATAALTDELTIWLRRVRG